MLNDNDKKEFAEILGTVMSLYGKDATKPLLMLYWNALIRFDISEVRTALNIWVQDPKQGTFMPKPADIIRTIGERLQPEQPKWISANEAWAIALPAADEAETVVWTQEIAKAWAISKPILEAGDKVGARMAFIPAYERFVESARNEGRLPQFEISAGWDAERRDRAVTNAVTAGLLPAPKQETKALAAPDKPTLFDDHVSAYHRYEMHLRLRDLSAMLKGQKIDQWEGRIKQAEQVAAIRKSKLDELASYQRGQS